MKGGRWRCGYGAGNTITKKRKKKDKDKKRKSTNSDKGKVDEETDRGTPSILKSGRFAMGGKSPEAKQKPTYDYKTNARY